MRRLRRAGVILALSATSSAVIGAMAPSGAAAALTSCRMLTTSYSAISYCDVGTGLQRVVLKCYDPAYVTTWTGYGPWVGRYQLSRSQCPSGSYRVYSSRQHF